jgi:hypothetical protein
MVQPVASTSHLGGTIWLILQLAVGALIAFFIVRAVTSLERIAAGIEALCEAARTMESPRPPAGSAGTPARAGDSEG